MRNRQLAVSRLAYAGRRFPPRLHFAASTNSRFCFACTSRELAEIPGNTRMADTLYQIMGRHRAEPLPERKPSWLKVKAPGGPNYARLRHLMRELDLHTVCEEAHCPNVGECWEHGTATFMILGDVCTRNCGYCAVDARTSAEVRSRASRVASPRPSREMRLQHAVITSVDRDDLPDFGAYIFAETIRQIHERVPGCSVEVLVPDFQGNEDSIRTVLEARPEIYNHNTETVPRLYKRARPGGRYERVMKIFRLSRSRIAPDIPTKTGIILGLGETIEEVVAVMRDLRSVDVDILTLGQYLRPSNDHLPLDRYYTPDEFRELARIGRGHGLPARGVRPARAVELSRVGTGAARRESGIGNRESRRRSSDAAFRPRTRRSSRHSGFDSRFPIPDDAMAKKKADNSAPSDDVELRRELLRSMLLQRRFEERCAEAYALGKIGGFCHLYIGQEACGTGAISVLRPDDYVDHDLPRSRTGARARHGAASRHGRAVRPHRRRRARQGRLDAPLRPQRRTSSAGTASSAATFRSRPASASRSSIAAAIRSASASWASRS